MEERRRFQRGLGHRINAGAQGAVKHAAKGVAQSGPSGVHGGAMGDISGQHAMDSNLKKVQDSIKKPVSPWKQFADSQMKQKPK